MITKGTPIDGVGFFALCRSEYSIVALFGTVARDLWKKFAEYPRAVVCVSKSSVISLKSVSTEQLWRKRLPVPTIQPLKM